MRIDDLAQLNGPYFMRMRALNSQRRKTCDAAMNSVSKALLVGATSLLGANLQATDEPTTLIRLNTVGYLPGAPKIASVAAACSNFSVVQMPEGANVLTGKVAGPVLNPDTRESLYLADFSCVTNAGVYQLVVQGVGKSAPFRIGSTVYREPFYVAMRGFYLWRCGTGVAAVYNGQRYEHGPCHTNDAWLDFVTGEHVHKDGTGGWHDAGDYNKYVVNAGVTVGVLLRAWEDFAPKIRPIRLDIPESGGRLPDFLAEVKWELDWLLKMQAPDGAVYHKLSTREFCGWIRPEDELTERYFTPWGTEATAVFVGMMAQAARVYRPFDAAFAEKCLAAARRSYEFLKAHPRYRPADQSAFRTGPYEFAPEVENPNRTPGAEPQNRLWAAAELWESTGEEQFLTDLEARIRLIRAQWDHDFDWPDVRNLGLVTYLFSRRPGRDAALVGQVQSNLLVTADAIVRAARTHGYARPLGTRYYWGCNGGVARQTVLLHAAYRVSQKQVYRETCLDALNHLFGRNYYGRSFVTGLGFRPPKNPHDRRSATDSVPDPWPGYLVGGSHRGAMNWQDVLEDYRSNEIAINWNAALVYALAAFLPEPEK
ncbi:MAG: glycoside hydrolase family 9 protein [Verrucomicrobiae bacterium]|nr:glycoside hydrolase family 9 protein [Verrucomicrobiae bacterium]MDW7980931.1 glycoside hydrolase family 9 protein [Verrucomicrobiales bacterium]